MAQQAVRAEAFALNDLRDELEARRYVLDVLLHDDNPANHDTARSAITYAFNDLTASINRVNAQAAKVWDAAREND